MKERILVITACVLSCVVIFGSIIAYKEYRKANVDIEASSNDISEKTEEDTSVEETTTQASEETTLEEESENNSLESTTGNKKPNKNKKPVQSTVVTETTTKESTTVESTTEEKTTEESTTVETTTEESTTEEPTTEKIYPVLAESKADMVRLINSLTASASQGDYTLTRDCYAEGEFVASDMEKLNEIIQNVNPDETFNSAINGYFCGTITATVENGRPTTDIKEEYLLKAMSLTVDDVRSWRQYENKIIVNLVNSRSPFAFENVTNDFITPDSINEFMSEYTTDYKVTGALLGFGPLSLEVTIDDGKLTNLKINHSVYVDVEFESGNRMEGTTYITETTYSDFVYN